MGPFVPPTVVSTGTIRNAVCWKEQRNYPYLTHGALRLMIGAKTSLLKHPVQMCVGCDREPLSRGMESLHINPLTWLNQPIAYAQLLVLNSFPAVIFLMRFKVIF